MGKGKVAPEEWVCVGKRGRMLYEMEGVEEKVAMEALRRASHTLPIATRIILREGME